MRIRAARPGEEDELTALAMRSKAHWGYDDAFMAACRDELTVGDVAGTAVAERDGRVVAFSRVTGELPEADLGLFFVEPDAVGTGIGRALWDHVVDGLRELGYRRLTIVADPNAVGFYERMGAVLVGREPSGVVPGRTLPLLLADLTGTPERGADRPLSTATVRRIVARYPPVGADPVFAGEGWDNELWEAGAWRFRFPKRAEIVPWLRREMSLQRMFADALEPVAVPRFEIVGEPDHLFPYPFVAYRSVPGVPAHRGPGPTRELAASYAGALSRLHALDPSVVPPTPGGWEEEGWFGSVRRRVPEEAETILERLPPDLRRLAEPYVAGDVEPPPFTGAERVLHNDIYDEHLLVDPVTGELAAIIDFADAMVGDPLLDLVGLVGWADLGWCDAVLERYRLELDPHAHDRLRWMARMIQLLWLAEATGDPRIAKHVAWVRRAFG